MEWNLQGAIWESGTQYDCLLIRLSSQKATGFFTAFGRALPARSFGFKRRLQEILLEEGARDRMHDSMDFSDKAPEVTFRQARPWR